MLIHSAKLGSSTATLGIGAKTDWWRQWSPYGSTRRTALMATLKQLLGDQPRGHISPLPYCPAHHCLQSTYFLFYLQFFLATVFRIQFEYIRNKEYLSVQQNVTKAMQIKT